MNQQMTMMNHEPLHIAGINYDSFVDGEGVRTAIYLSGCDHHCPGCQNEAAQNPGYGIVADDATIDRIAAEINARPYLSGITLTGGDPLYHHEQTLEFLLTLRKRLTRPLSVWLYTGDVWENVCSLDIMDLTDVLVDGPYDREQADKRLQFRGSSNQRIIDVKASRAADRVIEWKDTTN